MKFVHYLQVHGQDAGPTQRPILAGLLAGFAAALLSGAVLYATDVVPGLAARLGMATWALWVVHLVSATLEGALYGAVLRRAANSTHSAWLFGIGYAYLLWLAGPTFIELVTGIELAEFRFGLPILASHLTYGISLGVLFPFIHRPLHRRLEHVELENYVNYASQP